jgi:hypothetical protein
MAPPSAGVNLSGLDPLFHSAHKSRVRQFAEEEGGGAANFFPLVVQCNFEERFVADAQAGRKLGNEAGAIIGGFLFPGILE